MKVYQMLASAFKAEGISHIFGLMGDGNMYWMHELNKLGVKTLEVLHEGAKLGIASLQCCIGTGRRQRAHWFFYFSSLLRSDIVTPTPTSVLDRADVLFDRKFLRTTGMIIGAFPVLYGVVGFLEKNRGKSFARVCSLCVVAVALAVLGWNPRALAQNYPTHPVRLIAPFPPGGNVDVQARLIAQKLADRWGQQVVIDNRAGAGGTLGVDLAAKAAPDGHTIVFASFGNILVGPALYKKLPYDPVKDLAPIVLVSEPPGLMVVNRELAVANVRELIAYAQSNPGSLNYGSAGSGTWNHLFAELLNASAKIHMTHVPYKGIALAVTDLMGGRIQLVISPFPTALPHVKSGRLRALAVTGAKRSPIVPDVPTVSESGLPGYEAASWFAILGPAGTPQPIVSKINRDVNRVFSEREVKSAFAAEGADPVGGSPEDLAKSIREGMAKWNKLVRDLGVQL